MSIDYDCRPADKLYADLVILCNGCGEPMRCMGEWPVQWPKAEKPKNIQQAFRYTCRTCRIPREGIKTGIPVMMTIVGSEN